MKKATKKTTKKQTTRKRRTSHKDVRITLPIKTPIVDARDAFRMDVVCDLSGGSFIWVGINPPKGVSVQSGKFAEFVMFTVNDSEALYQAAKQIVASHKLRERAR